jgi:hypothetical protein
MHRWSTVGLYEIRLFQMIRRDVLVGTEPPA